MGLDLRIISLIGRPNVGKSSLFNALTKTKNALVADIPGLTRDRHYSEITIEKNKYLLVDTGGLDKRQKNEISEKMQEQTYLAIEESDLILFIVDAKDGLTPFDKEIASTLRKKAKNIILVINKTENMNDDYVISDFINIGISKKVPISCAHRKNINLLKEVIDETIEINIEPEYDLKSDMSISILGRPNVGKSTLINALIGEERFVAYDFPGTTRDAVSTTFIFKNKRIEITDTAGIRKKGKVDNVIEKFSILKALLAIAKSDVSVLLIDATDGLTSQDLQIFGYILNHGKPAVIALNKWDLLDSYHKDMIKKTIDKKINFLSNYEIFEISALKRLGLNNIVDAAFKAYNSSRKKISTSILNNFLSDLQNTHLPPIFKGIRPKLKYAHQGDVCPPTIIIHGNHLLGIKKDYERFIKSSLIKTFGLIGTPVSIHFKESENPYDSKIEKRVKKTGLVTRRKEINKRRVKKKL